MKNGTFNQKLSDSNLSEFKRYIGKQINHITIEKGSIHLIEFIEDYPYQVICNGKGRINFKKGENSRDALLLDFISTFTEVSFHYIDQGSFEFEHSNYSVPTAKEIMENGQSFYLEKELGTVVVYYPSTSYVRSIEFYGNSLHGMAKEIYPNEDYTEEEKNVLINCESIEFFVINHIDNFKSIFECSGGTYISMGFEKSIDEFIRKRYSDSEKNIILQHIIE